MGWLFVVAILGFVLYAFVKAKARRHYSNQVGALREVAAGPTDIPPSWVANKDRLEEVIDALRSWAVGKGLPESYIVVSFNHADTFQTIMEVAGAMEQRGASFTEQQAAMSHVLYERWKRFDDDARRPYIEAEPQFKAWR